MRYFVALMLVAMLATAGVAIPPPAHGLYQAGWGMCNANWDATSGSPFYAKGVWVPGQNWNLDLDGGAAQYLVYTPITLELWIELYAEQSYEFTSYQWHRIGDAAEDVSFIIQGYVKSNHPEYAGLTIGNDGTLDELIYRGGPLGFDNTAPNIPLTWKGRWASFGAGDTGMGLADIPVWHFVLEQGQTNEGPAWQDTFDHYDADGFYLLIDEPCDHWFQFMGTFHIDYHQADGYYSLTLAGCPAPLL